MGEREWVRGREDDEVGRASNLTCEMKETTARMVLARSGMQVSRNGWGDGEEFSSSGEVDSCHGRVIRNQQYLYP